MILCNTCCVGQASYEEPRREAWTLQVLSRMQWWAEWSLVVSSVRTTPAPTNMAANPGLEPGVGLAVDSYIIPLPKLSPHALSQL